MATGGKAVVCRRLSFCCLSCRDAFIPLYSIFHDVCRAGSSECSPPHQAPPILASTNYRPKACLPSLPTNCHVPSSWCPHRMLSRQLLGLTSGRAHNSYIFRGLTFTAFSVNEQRKSTPAEETALTSHLSAAVAATMVNLFMLSVVCASSPKGSTASEEAKAQASFQCAPSVFVPGTQKGASTFLFHAISWHPQVGGVEPGVESHWAPL